MTLNCINKKGQLLLKSLDGNKPIRLRDEMLIGRAITSDVVMKDKLLSKMHVKFYTGGGVTLAEDMGSTNGTYINGKKLSVGVLKLIKHDDIVSFGAHKYKLDASGGLKVSKSRTDKQPVMLDEILEEKRLAITPPKSWALNNSKESRRTHSLAVFRPSSNSGEHTNQQAKNIEPPMPILVCLSGTMKSKVYKFSTNGNLIKWEIGRSPDCDIQIEDDCVSTNHAQLLQDGLRWKLVDLMSTNGTYVNGVKSLTSYLSSGDKIRFSQSEFMFKLNSESRSTDEPYRVTAARSFRLTGFGWAIKPVEFFIATALLYLSIGHGFFYLMNVDPKGNFAQTLPQNDIFSSGIIIRPNSPDPALGP